MKGKWTPGSVSEFTVLAVIQMATGKDLQNLPEGLRGKSTVRVYTDVELFAARVKGETGGPAGPDFFTWKGRKYEVTITDPRDGTDLPHYKSIAVMAPVDEE